jgi:MFS family permease
VPGGTFGGVQARPVVRASSRRGELINARRAVAITFIVHGTLSGAWAPRIPEIKADLHLSNAALGLALLAPALATVLAARTAGFRTAMHGSGPATRVLAIGFCVTAWLPGVAWNLPSLFVALLIWGAAMGAMDIAMNAQGVTVEQGYGRPVLSSFHAAWSFGAFGGALLGGLGVALHVPISVQQTLIGVVAAGIVQFVGRDFLTDEPHDLPERRRRFALPGRPQTRLVLLGLAAVCALLAEGAVADWSGILLRDHLGVTGGWVSAGYACFAVCMTGGRLVGDRGVHYFGRGLSFAVCAVFGATGLGIGLTIDQPVAVVVGFGALGLGLSIMVPVLFSTAADTRGPSGPAIAAVSALGFTGMLCGPSVIGFIANGTSVWAALMLVPPIVLVGGVLGVTGVRVTARINRRAAAP